MVVNLHMFQQKSTPPTNMTWFTWLRSGWSKIFIVILVCSILALVIWTTITTMPGVSSKGRPTMSHTIPRTRWRLPSSHAVTSEAASKQSRRLKTVLLNNSCFSLLNRCTNFLENILILFFLLNICFCL